MTTLRDLVLRVGDGSVIQAVAQLPTCEGPKAKPYQVEQVRKILAKYKLLCIMENARYEMIVWWSNVDHAFVVDVPELPGCMAHGNTRAEAIANAEEAVA